MLFIALSKIKVGNSSIDFNTNYVPVLCRRCWSSEDVSAKILWQLFMFTGSTLDLKLTLIAHNTNFMHNPVCHILK